MAVKTHTFNHMQEDDPSKPMTIIPARRWVRIGGSKGCLQGSSAEGGVVLREGERGLHPCGLGGSPT